MNFTIFLSEKQIEVCCLYDTTRNFCKEYLAEGPAELRIQTFSEDILFEREKSKKEAEIEGRKIVEYSDEYLETLAVYRKIAEALIDHDTLLFHGSVIAVDGKGYLFTAKSGTGKSTHTRLWREAFGERAVMVNDDKPLLKLTEDGVIAYGTPWNGKHQLGTNTSVPLKAICILERDKENHIERITRKEAYNMLVQQTYKPKDAGKLMKTLQTIDRLANKVELYRLGCNMEKDAAMVAYNGMNEECCCRG